VTDSELRTAIAGAVKAIRRNEADDGSMLLNSLATSSPRTTQTCVLELASANAEMLLSLSGRPPGTPSSDDVVVTVASRDSDDGAVGIDELAPVQRATTRIMLAIANDCPEDAEIQLDIVSQANRSGELRSVFVDTLVWTLELLDLCERAHRPVPSWLQPVGAGH
jgi:hypothetical protein